MGAEQSTNSHLKGYFGIISKWSWSRVQKIFSRFVEEKFELTIDILDLMSLLDVDSAFAMRMTDILAMNESGMVNSMILLSTILLLADSSRPLIEARAGLLYDLLNLDNGNNINMDELTILLNAISYACCLIFDCLDQHPTETILSQASTKIFDYLQINEEETISKQDFITTVKDLMNFTSYPFLDLEQILPTLSAEDLLQSTYSRGNEDNDSQASFSSMYYVPPININGNENHSRSVSKNMSMTSSISTYGYTPEFANSQSFLQYEPQEELSLEEQLAGIPSLTQHHLSAMASILQNNSELYQEMSQYKTKRGFGFDQAVIQCGIDCPSLSIGCVLGDEDCYLTYKKFYDLLYLFLYQYPRGQWHKSDLIYQHISDDGDYDFDRSYVRSCTVKASRNVAGFALMPCITRAERRKVEEILMNVTEKLTDEFSGKYFNLDSNDKGLEHRLIFEKSKDNSMTAVSGCNRDWPDARGVYHNKDRTFVVWVNEEDHIRVISMEKGGNVKRVFQRWCEGITAIETNLIELGYKYLYNPHLGYLATCPSNVGTSMRIGMSVKLPLLSNNYFYFPQLCDRVGLDCIQFHNANGWCDISNKYKLNVSETESVQTVVNGVRTLITFEKVMEESSDLNTLNEMLDSLPPFFQSVVIETDYKVMNVSLECVTPVLDVELGYPVFTPDHTSLMSKFLSRSIYEELITRSTSNGVTIDDIIKCGLNRPQDDIGLTAGDEECYDTFRAIFNPVLSSWHNCDATLDHGEPEIRGRYSPAFNKLLLSEALDFTYIISTKITLSRNISGFPMLPSIDRIGRRKVSHAITTVLAELQDEFAGTYNSLHVINNLKETSNDPIYKSPIYFEKTKDNSMTAVSGCNRDWPDARGVYHNKDRTFVVWVNEEDHIRVISMEKGGNVKRVFARAVKGLNLIEDSLEDNGGLTFQYSDRLGYLTMSPSRVGTALHVAITLNLPTLGKNELMLRSVCTSLNFAVKRLSKAPTTTTHTLKSDKTTPRKEYYWEISNMITLGLSEIEILQTVIEGVVQLIGMDKSLTTGGNIGNIINESKKRTLSF